MTLVDARRFGVRARLAAGYGLAMAVVLTIVSAIVGTLHERLGLARLDDELAHAMQSVSGVVNSEVDERRELAAGAREAMYELELPGTGVAVLDASSTVLAARNAGAPSLTPEQQREIAITKETRTLDPDRIRVAASQWQHRSSAYTVVVWTALAPLDRDHATVMTTLRIAIPIGALAAVGAGWLMVRRALRPLSSMAHQADAISPRQLDARLPVPRPADELQRLAIAFNGVLERLSRSVNLQRRFMADASHELRTPISVARTAAQVTLSAPHRTEAEYREAADIVAGQTQRMTRIVDDMFLLALADVDGRPLISRLVDFDEVAADAVRAAALLAAERNITITLAAPESVQLRGDEELLRRMVMNLLDNAIRYAPEHSRVSVTLSIEKDARVSLSVADEGRCIAPEQRERIFERFVRLDTARPTSGGGLGLPIARWIAEQHGGSLELQSHASGNRFIAILGAAS